MELARAIRSAYELAVEPLEIDAREFHIYSADWTPEQVSFEVDGDPVKTVRQSPVYPMQLMLGIYEFPGENEERVPEAYPKGVRRTSYAATASSTSEPRARGSLPAD